MMIKYKLREVATDLGVKNKDVIDVLSKYVGGEPKKQTSVLTEEELNIVFDYFTQKNNLDSLDSYYASNTKTNEQDSKSNTDEKPVKKNNQDKPKQADKKPQPKADNNQKKDRKPANDKKPQPKAEVKENNNQSDNNDVQFKNRKERKIVDTRQVVVDVERYNEKYDRLASEKIRSENQTAHKQKINQRSQQRGKQKRGKRETEQERLNRIAMERKKKPITVSIPDEITVSELALRLKATAAEVIKKLFMLGVMATVNDTIDFDTASLVAMEFHAKVEKEVVVTIEERIIDDSEDDDSNLVERAPVVVVMGHVDHGKTSLLDAIRHANVTSGEAGGITQHIGAYRVNVGERDITFLDTPGHEAFTTMRARGAMATDIAILVVAADDGIMPQTVEAINHAKAAGVSIIVAINKMDKPTANPDQVKQQLTEHSIVPEEWGGDVPCIPVSAKTKEGLDDLLEMVILTADIMELKANPDRSAKGVVIEARLDKGRGPIATMLVQNGTLNTGDIIVAGTTVGRVRAMTNDRGEKVKTAGPSYPVEISGLDEVPVGGDIFNAVSDERLARELVEQRKTKAKEELFNAQTKVTLDNLFDQMQLGELKELKVIVKADVQGSVEAVKQSLAKLANEEVRVNVIHGAVGAVNESDVNLAKASNAIIVGFNVRPDAVAQATAERDGVELRMYRVIYDAIEEIEQAMKGMLAPKTREVELGKAECRNVIKIKNVGFIAGSYVLSGKIERNAMVRVVRDGIVIAEDTMSSLQRFKDSVKEVAAGYECGIGLEHFADLKEGDIFEVYKIEE
ncbi:MAG: translation initiation factor IF-2, partial [Acutalibacteraceae bacterium]|nr:translation initiation factor IF-2 [Acutalibacteraceae bacterium]